MCMLSQLHVCLHLHSLGLYWSLAGWLLYLASITWVAVIYRFLDGDFAKGKFREFEIDTLFDPGCNLLDCNWKKVKKE